MAIESLNKLERLYVAYYLMNIVLTRTPHITPSYRMESPSPKKRTYELCMLVAKIADVQGDHGSATAARSGVERRKDEDEAK